MPRAQFARPLFNGASGSVSSQSPGKGLAEEAAL
jgi:hypothetical protein